jgi:MFS family permease
MIQRSNNRALQALISLVRNDEEPLRQRRAMQITALVAAALFMENLDSTINHDGAPADGAILPSRPIGLNIGVTAYTLTLAVVIPISGWMAERFGTGACSRRDRDIHRRLGVCAGLARACLPGPARR